MERIDGSEDEDDEWDDALEDDDDDVGPRRNLRVKRQVIVTPSSLP